MGVVSLITSSAKMLQFNQLSQNVKVKKEIALHIAVYAETGNKVSVHVMQHKHEPVCFSAHSCISYCSLRNCNISTSLSSKEKRTCPLGDLFNILYKLVSKQATLWEYQEIVLTCDVVYTGFLSNSSLAASQKQICSTELLGFLYHAPVAESNHTFAAHAYIIHGVNLALYIISDNIELLRSSVTYADANPQQLLKGNILGCTLQNIIQTIVLSRPDILMNEFVSLRIIFPTFWYVVCPPCFLRAIFYSALLYHQFNQTIEAIAL